MAELQVNQKETLRYLGYQGIDPAMIDHRILDFIHEITEEYKQKCRMRSISRRVDLSIDGSILTFADSLKVESAALAKNLSGCSEVVLFAATLGAEADVLISRYSRRDMSKGVMAEAAATSVIEAYCDSCQGLLEEEMNREGKYLRPRFSPGYGDFNIRHQQDMMTFLDCPRKIGLTLTDNLMMVPTKSVTAVMGISDKPWRHKPKDCQACTKIDCDFRK